MLFIPLSALALVIALVSGFTDTSGPVDHVATVAQENIDED